MNAIAISSPVVADERAVPLNTLYVDLGIRDINRARSKFEAFVHKVGYTNCGKSFKSDTYVEPVNGKIVATYIMTHTLAAAFAVYCDPAKGFALITKVAAQPIDAIHHDLLFEINIPERWVIEIIKRRPGSVRATLRTARERTTDTALAKHWECRADGYWYSAWFLANAPFTKLDGMLFKSALTVISETLGIETEMRQYLPTQPT